MRLLEALLPPLRRSPHRLPEGRRVYAVGDVHGCLDLLRELVAHIHGEARADGVEAEVIFLGDLIDRGPDSAGVVEFVRRLCLEPGVRAVKGNHEEALLRSLEDDETLKWFLPYGGRETALSYGIGADEYRRLDIPQLRRRLREAIPEAHRDFMARMEDAIRVGGCLFTHAGVRPGVGLDEQSPEDLRWIRGPFLGARGDLGARIVHGHTISRRVEARRNRIGVDTGAYETGRLSAAGLEGGRHWVIEATRGEGAHIETRRR